MSAWNNLDAIASLPFAALSGPEAGEQIRDSLIAEIRDLRAERDRLASLVEKLRPYLRHRSTVCARNNHADPCDCGLADLLTEMETM